MGSHRREMRERYLGNARTNFNEAIMTMTLYTPETL